MGFPGQRLSFSSVSGTPCSVALMLNGVGQDFPRTLSSVFSQSLFVLGAILVKARRIGCQASEQYQGVAQAALIGWIVRFAVARPTPVRLAARLFQQRVAGGFAFA